MRITYTSVFPSSNLQTAYIDYVISMDENCDQPVQVWPKKTKLSKNEQSNVIKTYLNII